MTPDDATVNMPPKRFQIAVVTTTNDAYLSRWIDGSEWTDAIQNINRTLSMDSGYLQIILDKTMDPMWFPVHSISTFRLKRDDR